MTDYEPIVPSATGLPLPPDGPVGMADNCQLPDDCLSCPLTCILFEPTDAELQALEQLAADDGFAAEMQAEAAVRRSQAAGVHNDGDTAATATGGDYDD